MYTITFYSFKGGVGRTMALVNVAAELARKGRKVLVVDFDLEAPGLETFKQLKPPPSQPGIVEYVTEFVRRKQAPDVREYVYSAGPVGKKGGEIWVMPAGRRDSNYQTALTNINWKSLYRHDEGFLFFEYTKQRWEEEYKPDYVLIDARTGHTDIEGICTRQLADAVVVVFYPNEQNLAGLRQVVRHIRAEETSGMKKKITLHFVASNVPDLDDEHGLLRRQLNLFEQELEILGQYHRQRVLTIYRHESLSFLKQPVFVLQRPWSRLSREYRQLAHVLVMDNPVDRDGALLYLRGLQRGHYRRKSGRYPGFSEARQRLIQIESQFNDDPNVLRSLARWHEVAGEPDLALRQYDRILQLRPNWPDALYMRGLRRLEVNNTTEAAGDFLQFLRTSRSPDYFPPPGDEQEKVKWMESRALERLIEHSFESFLQALALPALRDESYSEVSRLLFFASEHLLRERRWADAIQYLETTAPALLTQAHSLGDADFDRILLLDFQSSKAWYLAMATWGKTGHLRADLCQNALELFGACIDDFPEQDLKNLQHLSQLLLRRESDEESGPENPKEFQRLSLLYWGIGDPETASALLDRALEESSKSPTDPGVSNWTFREASWHEFRQHCEQQRRMIHGEPIRPAFLGPPS